jgi:ABC-type Zn2+ transport system substrate-binding protein/surface adhesin
MKFKIFLYGRTCSRLSIAIVPKSSSFSTYKERLVHIHTHMHTHTHTHTDTHTHTHTHTHTNTQMLLISCRHSRAIASSREERSQGRTGRDSGANGRLVGKGLNNNNNSIESRNAAAVSRHSTQYTVVIRE